NELAGLLEELGDLTTAEVAERASADPEAMLDSLRAEGRVRAIDFGTGRHAWISTLEAPMYTAIGATPVSDELDARAAQSGRTTPDPKALESILLRAVRGRRPVSVPLLARRYHAPEADVAPVLDASEARGALRKLP